MLSEYENKIKMKRYTKYLFILEFDLIVVGCFFFHSLMLIACSPKLAYFQTKSKNEEEENKVSMLLLLI